MIAISVVLLLITGTIGWIQIRGGLMSWPSWLNSALFGFAIASTSLAPHITNAITSVGTWVGHI